MMRLISTLALLWLHSQPVFSQQYQLLQHYNASNFFEEFHFYTSPDPTGGFVQYLPFENASTTGIVSNETGLVYLGVDSTHIYTQTDQGRPSVRLESKMTFTEGLFIINLTHIPVGCGTWPAFWTAGLGDWQNDGEIDIIENVNDARTNNAALHAAGSCRVLNSSSQTGLWKSTDCNTKHDGNQGCGITFTEPYNYGAEFNANGGGIYAMEWKNDSIDIWFFTHDKIPSTLKDGTAIPNPQAFGTPSASFAGPCSDSFGEKFFNHTIIIDTTFCGGYAGGLFGSGASECPVLEKSTPIASCVDYVARNPTLFEDAWWGIQSLKVWEEVYAYTPGLGVNTTFVIETPPPNYLSVPPSTSGVLSVWGNDKSNTTTIKLSRSAKPTTKKTKTTKSSRKPPKQTKNYVPSFEKHPKQTSAPFLLSDPKVGYSDVFLTIKSSGSIPTKTSSTLEALTSTGFVIDNLDLGGDFSSVSPDEAEGVVKGSKWYDWEVDGEDKLPDVYAEGFPPGNTGDSTPAFSPVTIEDYFPGEGPQMSEISDTLAPTASILIPTNVNSRSKSTSVGNYAATTDLSGSKPINALDWGVITSKQLGGTVGSVNPDSSLGTVSPYQNGISPSYPLIQASDGNSVPKNPGFGDTTSLPNTPASIWEALGDGIQDQILALANSLPANPTNVPGAPVTDAVEPKPPMAYSSTPVAALDKTDTSQAIGTLLGFFNEAAKQQITDLADLPPGGMTRSEATTSQASNKSLDTAGLNLGEKKQLSDICPGIAFDLSPLERLLSDLQDPQADPQLILGRLRNDLEAQSAKLQQCIWSLKNYVGNLESSEKALHARQEPPSLTGNVEFDNYLQQKESGKKGKWNYGIMSKEEREKLEKAAMESAAQKKETPPKSYPHSQPMISNDTEDEASGDFDTGGEHIVSTYPVTSRPSAAAVSPKDSILGKTDVIWKNTSTLGKLQVGNSKIPATQSAPADPYLNDIQGVLNKLHGMIKIIQQAEHQAKQQNELEQAKSIIENVQKIQQHTTSPVSTRNHPREFHRSEDSLEAKNQKDSLIPIPTAFLGKHGTPISYGIPGPQIPSEPKIFADPKQIKSLPEESEEVIKGTFDELEDSSEDTSSSQLGNFTSLDPFGQLDPQVPGAESDPEEDSEETGIDLPTSTEPMPFDALKGTLEESSESSPSPELSKIPPLDPFGQLQSQVEPSSTPSNVKHSRPLFYNGSYEGSGDDAPVTSDEASLEDSSEDPPSPELQNIPPLDPFDQLGSQPDSPEGDDTIIAEAKHSIDDLDPSSEAPTSPELANLPPLDPFGELDPRIPDGDFDDSDDYNGIYGRSEPLLPEELELSSLDTFLDPEILEVDYVYDGDDGSGYDEAQEMTKQHEIVTTAGSVTVCSFSEDESASQHVCWTIPAGEDMGDDEEGGTTFPLAAAAAAAADGSADDLAWKLSVLADQAAKGIPMHADENAGEEGV
ncbi:unnamed protein product [Periconia digitata]|uniref:GH16 domain-containing protein n=1 Tax=Periconia digitata TaxID=1303443 RepID=A0A9W4XQB1_9PLEO|nr:unnamed protein product [Periconia digitata]